jgi:ABC-type nitrate/sulfonate/bicarbonate transport system ATPase subunit
VEKNIRFGLKDADPQKVEHTLEGFALRDKRKTFPHRLSGGEQQRVAMARLALMNAGVILCDEPFSSIDAVKRQDMWDRLRALVTENKATALVVTHEPQEALMHADFVCVLLKGPMRVCASLTLPDGFRHNFELQKSAQGFYVEVLRSGACAAVPDCLRDYTEQNLTSIESVKTARAE